MNPKTIKATERKGRPGLFEAKGQDPLSLKRKSYYGSTPQEAERKALASYGFTSVETLYEFYGQVYLPTVVARSQNWKDQIAWAMDRHVIPAFGNREIKQIDRAELQRFFNGLKMQTTSKRRVKIVLSGVFGLAEDDGIIVRNPVSKIRLPKDQPKEKTALTFEELHKLIECSHDLIRPFVLLGAIGLRAGEALGVTFAHIGDSVQVRQQVLQPRGGCKIEKTLKTPQSNRTIPITEAYLTSLRSCNQKSGMFVCSDTQGGFLTPNNATRELEIAVKAAGIPRITPHELRHTFISLMENELEAPEAIVASLAGRMSKGINAGYSHSHRRQLERWMKVFLDRLLPVSVVQTVVRETQ